ncbi:hypothetical protein POM88_026375 [Heracleum sosnowskyi]|uniref:Uncharacterized protein n=1 Tax=Heracleum sosnowskyi TaxID=360622 RepID=A0AAD8I6W2_9APIA|nr:hypothetical protein POM88_026375 [Heracleum sosnowskyi]
MELITKCITTVLFFSLVLSTMRACDDDKANPIITQELSGKKIQNQSQWKVTLKAPCNCCQTNVKISCRGFKTVEPLDLNVFAQNGDVCSPNGSLCPGSSTTFTYAWNTPYNFTTLSFQVACS